MSLDARRPGSEKARKVVVGERLRRIGSKSRAWVYWREEERDSERECRLNLLGGPFRGGWTAGLLMTRGMSSVMFKLVAGCYVGIEAQKRRKQISFVEVREKRVVEK